MKKTTIRSCEKLCLFETFGTFLLLSSVRRAYYAMGKKINWILFHESRPWKSEEHNTLSSRLNFCVLRTKFCVISSKIFDFISIDVMHGEYTKWIWMENYSFMERMQFSSNFRISCLETSASWWANLSEK